MAEQDIKPDAGISKGLRQLKVGYTSIRHADSRDMTTYYSQCPSIVLKGNWLADASFESDTPVDVRVMPGHLLLSVREPAPELPAEPEVVTMLKRVCKKLSARKQQQIAEFIQVIAGPQKRATKV